NSAKTFIAGISLEFGSVPKQKEKTVDDPILITRREIIENSTHKNGIKHTNEPSHLEDKDLSPPTKIEHTIHFAYNSAELPAVELSSLNEVLDTLLDNKSVNVLIAGHASSEGDVQHNYDLSLRRANTVL